MGKIVFFSKAIYLNINYTYRLAGLPTLYIFDFEYLFYTLAHELAHCLLGDFNPEWIKEHSEEHNDLTQEIEDYLWTLPEVQELEKLQTSIDQLAQESKKQREN